MIDEYMAELHSQNSGIGIYKGNRYTIDAPCKSNNDTWVCMDFKFLAKGMGETKEEAVNNIIKSYENRNKP